LKILISFGKDALGLEAVAALASMLTLYGLTYVVVEQSLLARLVALFCGDAELDRIACRLMDLAARPGSSRSLNRLWRRQLWKLAEAIDLQLSLQRSEAVRAAWTDVVKLSSFTRERRVKRVLAKLERSRGTAPAVKETAGYLLHSRAKAALEENRTVAV